MRSGPPERRPRTGQVPVSSSKVSAPPVGADLRSLLFGERRQRQRRHARWMGRLPICAILRSVPAHGNDAQMVVPRAELTTAHCLNQLRLHQLPVRLPPIFATRRACLLAEIPTVLRADLYAVAALAGAAVRRGRRRVAAPGDRGDDCRRGSLLRAASRSGSWLFAAAGTLPVAGEPERPTPNARAPKDRKDEGAGRR
jgi:hypothetical protein